jgi:hypothetical protein
MTLKKQEPSFRDLRVRFFVAAIGEGGHVDLTADNCRQVFAFPTEVSWSWQKAYIDRDNWPAWMFMQQDIIADAIKRPDLGGAAVELVNIRPAPREETSFDPA